MTPLGEKIRQMRQERGASQKDMAAAIGVSAAYLSALEHGRRGVPSWTLLQKIIGYFNIIWDEAEEFQRLAETSGLSPAATELANLLAEGIDRLDEAEIRHITASVRQMLERAKRAGS